LGLLDVTIYVASSHNNELIEAQRICDEKDTEHRLAGTPKSYKASPVIIGLEVTAPPFLTYGDVTHGWRPSPPP
jgi:hypothetical protein